MESSVGAHDDCRRCLQFDTQLRTAAIHYANGSTVSVARVEGSPAYQDFMRRDAALPSTARPLCNYISSILSTFPSVCACPVGQDTAGVEVLMRELRASVVSSMGTDFCYANLAFWSRRHAPAYQKQAVEQDFANTGLTQPIDTVLDDGLGAIHANGIGNTFDQDLPPVLILVADYSHYGLGVQLFWRDADGFLVRIREDHRLGAGPETAGDMLRAIVAFPFGDDPSRVDWSDPLPTEITQLVLHGDAVLNDDNAFQEAPRDVT